MEIASVVEFIENKIILITGATGFLATVFLEKILRVQPNVKKIYLLLRAPNLHFALRRFENEIIEKDLFRTMKEKLGSEFKSFIEKKIVVVGGDIANGEDLGVEDSNLREEMWRELDVVVNLAATTNFDERYDVALEINTMGVKHMMCFAKKCIKLQVFVHVSTAYVSGEKKGLVLESPREIGESLNGVCGLDIFEEKKLIDETLNLLQTQGATNDHIKKTMKDLGIARAREYGWPNTYLFTKAMGEMVIGHFKENLSVVIIRPTIILSTYKEPFSGWIEGLRTIDTFIVAYGKGRLQWNICNYTTIYDVIPADMVVNMMIVAMVAHANQPNPNAIYQIGSSLKNPVTYRNLDDFCYRSFTKKPLIDKNGKVIKVHRPKMMKSISGFHKYMATKLLIIKVLQLANVVSCYFCFNEIYTKLNRKVKSGIRMMEIYRPFFLFPGKFDDANTERLRNLFKQNSSEIQMFEFDPTIIDWEDYFMNIHIPGLVKYVCK